MYQTNSKPAATTVVLALAALSWIACGQKKPTEQETTAALPDLPQTEIAKLMPVPHSQMLATSEVQQPPTAPPETAIHPDCAANASETDYTAEVNYPITVCTFPNGPSVPIGTTEGPSAATHKLNTSNLSAQQKAATGQSSQAIIWWCHQDKGPWQGYLTSERGCSGVCAPQNVLTLTNAPNLVTFHWAGSVVDPSGAPFTYASKPVAVGPPVDEGRCHAQNVAGAK